MSGRRARRAACFRTAPGEHQAGEAVPTGRGDATRARLPPLVPFGHRPPLGGSRGRAARAGTSGPGSSPASVSGHNGSVWKLECCWDSHSRVRVVRGHPH